MENHKFGGDETIVANDSERPFKGCYAPDALQGIQLEDIY